MSLSIGEDINAATRSLHTPLNRQILFLLPLALPPEARTPFLYAYGISHFLPIYGAFESSFRSFLLSSFVSPRMGALLRKLHLPELERSDRLERDIEQIFSRHEVKGGWRVGKGSEQQAFLEHIRLSTTEKPYLLIAHTWIFYMALFSGGRYLRSRLRSAGSEFWRAKEEEELPLTFWTFSDGTNDGEDLKRLYKARVVDLSSSLTHRERQEIVAEAVEIMRWMLRLVEEARELLQAEEQIPPVSPPQSTSLLPSGLTELLGGFGRAVATGFHRSSNLIKRNE